MQGCLGIDIYRYLDFVKYRVKVSFGSRYFSQISLASHLKNHPHKLSLQVINKTVSNDVRAPHFDPVTYILQYPPTNKKTQ